MKFSTIFAIIMATVPALATDLVFKCKQVYWDGQGDETQFYRTFFTDHCLDYACTGTDDSWTVVGAGDQVVVGKCTGCPNNVKTDPPTPACLAYIN
ncbi:hypothetical protein E4U54_000953 [Claviceps lovelessii]|nr:hypothetical protein E4U54_000953 [Claviceps lovelessii]